MPVVVPLITSAISAGATIYGANKASSANTDAATTQANASKEAAQYQYASSQDALNFAKSVYGRTQDQVSPYVGYGQGALAALGTGLGVTPRPQSPVSLPASQPLPWQVTGLTPAQTQQATNLVQSTLSNPNENFMQRRTDFLNLGKLTDPSQLPGGANAAPPQTGSSVQMKAPTGEVGSVPADQVDHYLALGATRV